MPEELKTAEQKALEKEQKAIEKILDKDDSFFCGFSSFNVIDQDGYSKMIKGCNVDGPLFCDHVSGNVVITASFAPRPHAYLCISNDDQLYIAGNLWYGEAKRSPTNMIGKIIPKKMDVIRKEMEKDNDSKFFSCEMELPFLKNSAKRLQKIVFETVEQRFLTKVCGFKLELSEADWMEFKEYKLRFWKVGKAAGASTEGGEDDKKDDKKDEEKKD